MDSSAEKILALFRMVFRPVAKILLRAGIHWKEVAEVGKATYVEVAGAEFGIRGRPTNASRVAILTGFTRKEVARLRGVLSGTKVPEIERMNHATRVLTGWYTDPDFLADDGSPRSLKPDGGKATFTDLCKRYASDVPATTMLKELKHVGAVAQNSDGMLIAQTRYYMPQQLDDAMVLSSGSVLEDIGNTVAYNLAREEGDRPRFERRATNTRIPAGAAANFQTFLEAEGQAFLERVDQWLTEHELNPESDEKAIRLGLGTYWIEQ